MSLQPLNHVQNVVTHIEERATMKIIANKNLATITGFLLKYVNFSNEELNIISTKFHKKSIAKNELFMAEGVICRKIAFIEKGALILSQVSKNGNERILDFFTAGSMITDYFSFLKNSPTDTRIKAATQATIWVVKKEEIEFLYETSPNFQKLGRLLAESHFIQLAEKLKSDTLPPIERYERLIAQKPNIIEEFPQYMIASYLGISPEWLSKIRAQK